MKSVAFIYIRADITQLDFRDIIRKPKEANGSIFGDKELWNNQKTILDTVAEVEESSVEECLEKHEGEEPTKVLKARDNEWQKKVRKVLTEKFQECKDVIDNRQVAKEPLRLLSKALNAIQSIDKKAPSFKDNLSKITIELDKIISAAQILKNGLNR